MLWLSVQHGFAFVGDGGVEAIFVNVVRDHEGATVWQVDVVGTSGDVTLVTPEKRLNEKMKKMKSWISSKWFWTIALNKLILH